ncbi:MAG: hypothetical protein R2823_07260 [Acidimicrobiia bacterium]
MTTDQIRKAGVENADGTDIDASVAEATAKAKQIIAKARYDAFRMVTDARDEAEAILVDARSSLADGGEPATDISDLEARHAALVAANEALSAEHDRLLDQVARTRSLVEQLENRLARIASVTDSPPPPERGDSSHSTNATAVSQTEPAPPPRKGLTMDYSPSVPSPRAPETPSKEEATEVGSFYSRRSAKLPRIGTEGERSALSAMRTIRAGLEEE